MFASDFRWVWLGAEIGAPLFVGDSVCPKSAIFLSLGSLHRLRDSVGC